MIGEWRCTLCHTANLVPAPVCRVCRTPWAGGTRDAAAALAPVEAETPPTASLPASLPAPLALLVFAFVLALWWEPITRPLAVPTMHSGWTAAGTVERREELRLAHRELARLSAELGSLMRSGGTLPADWTSRLSGTRQRWRLYGDTERHPRLGGAEVALCTAILELASIRHQLAAGSRPDELQSRFEHVVASLATAEQELRDVR